MSSEIKKPKAYLYSIGTLRGLFVVLVAMFHFIHGSGLQNDCYGCMDSFGQLAYPGMLGFFIISGFGITWSMYLGGYKLKFVPRFYLKRITRAEPPYLIGLVIIVATNYLVSLRPGYMGLPMTLDWTQIALHVGYLVPFFGYEWLNPVFWTLSVEFQFYLAIGLLFPLFTSKDWRLRSLAMLALIAVHLTTPQLKYTVNTYIPLFLIGIVMFQDRVSMIGRREMLLWLAILLPLTFRYEYGAVVGFVCLLCVAMLLKDDHYSRIGNWFGEISYSLYLMHPPVSLVVIGFLLHFSHSWQMKLFGIALSLLLSALAAKIFFRFVENPWFRLSHNIRYPKDPQPLQAAQVPMS